MLALILPSVTQIDGSHMVNMCAAAVELNAQSASGNGLCPPWLIVAPGYPPPPKLTRHVHEMVTVEWTLRALAGVIISDSWHAPVSLCQSVLIFVSPAGSIVSEVLEPVAAADGAAAVSRKLPPQLRCQQTLGVPPPSPHLHLSNILFKESCTNLWLACIAL